MSWFYAIFARKGETLDGTDPIHSTPLYIVRNNACYVAAGGIPETCLFGGSAERGWVVTGLGIRVTDDRTSMLGREDWEISLGSPEFQSSILDGHFAVLRWDSARVEGLVDILGQRTMYFAEYGSGFCVSTRLDWVCRTTHSSEIDFQAFGSRWLLFNQLEHDSCVSGVGRVGPNERIAFDGSEITKHRGALWSPQCGCVASAEAVIQSIARCALSVDISLGFSGGLDSRTLLAVLLHVGGKKFSVHTFGIRDHPDVEIPSLISAQLGLDQNVFDEPLPPPDETFALLQEYASQIDVCEQCSSAVKLRYYARLGERNLMMVDGGFGEIARRQYLNRVVHFGRSAFRKRDAAGLIPLMSVNRGNIFMPEVCDMMKTGALESLERVLALLPDTAGECLENAVDLLAVRTRVPNYGSPEQARLDTQVLNFMPFVQPSFLSKALGLSIAQRNSGRFYRSMIWKYCRPLTRFPLEKSGIKYGFGLSTRGSWIVTRAKKKLGMAYTDDSADRLLVHIRDFVMDCSTEVTGFAAYDKKKIRTAVDGYYSTHHPDLRTTVLWWLSFELWRRSLST